MKRASEINLDVREGKRVRNYTMEIVPGVDRPLKVTNGEYVLFQYNGTTANGKLSNMCRYGPTDTSVEQRFHLNKILCLANEVAPQDVMNYCLECLRYDGPPRGAKRLGSKATFKSKGFKLDVERWNSVRKNIMCYLASKRYHEDEEFRRIIKYCKEKEYTIIHTGRAGANGYWEGTLKNGACVGRNVMGYILMCLYNVN